MKKGVGNVATTIPKKSKKGGEMMRKECDAIDVRELLALVYADLQRRAQEAQKRAGGDDEVAEIQVPSDDRTEEA